MSAKLEDVFAVVVNWNGGAANLDCLQALFEAGVPAERTLFIDNGSRDGSLELVQARFGDLQVLVNPSNLGYGVAANQGARRALEQGARFVLFLNNDALLDPDCVQQLVKTGSDRGAVGFLGPRIVVPGEPARLWAAGGRVGFHPNLSKLLGQGQPDGPAWQQTRRVDYVPGCALLARRECLEQIGLFDEAYFAYTEDVDLGLRAVAAGWENCLVGAARVVHRASSATGGGYNPRRKYLMGLGSLRFLRSHGGFAGWAGFWLWDVGVLPLVWLCALPRGKGRAVAAKGLGILHGILGKTLDPGKLNPGKGLFW
jgi:hypothetical protein